MQMKYRLRFIMILGVILLVLAGCAGAASTPSGTPGSQSSPPGSQAPATTTSAQTVHVTISDQQVSADRSTFSAGVPYHFIVTNRGQATYQFRMGQGEWGWQDDHMPMGWQHRMTTYQSYQIAPGETKTFDYTFPPSAVRQPFGFGCYQMGRQRGLWYPFTVQPQGTAVSS